MLCTSGKQQSANLVIECIKIPDFLHPGFVHDPVSIEVTVTVDQQLDRVHLRLNVVHMALHNHHLRLQLLELILHQTQVSRRPVVPILAEQEDVVLIGTWGREPV